MLQFLVLALCASIRILSVRQTFSVLKIRYHKLHVYKFLSTRTLKKDFFTRYTCCFTVPYEDEALVKFFIRSLMSQLCPMKPYQQHPVSMLFVALLTCGQTCTALDSRENNSASKTGGDGLSALNDKVEGKQNSQSI